MDVPVALESPLCIVWKSLATFITIASICANVFLSAGHTKSSTHYGAWRLKHAKGRVAQAIDIKLQYVLMNVDALTTQNVKNIHVEVTKGPRSLRIIH